MKEFFKSYREVLLKEVSSVITNYKKISNKNYPWSNDALERLEKFVSAGKLIRGTLVILAAQPRNAKSLNDAVKIGSALELMHSGILIHDDIMDRDEKRRGLPTIYAQYKSISSVKDKEEQLHYGESLASCVAIISYFLAFGQFSKIGSKQSELLHLFSEEMVRLGLAQMDDVDMATHHEKVSFKSVLRIYEQKTGRYTFALPLIAGFSLAGKGSAKTSKNVFELAEYLGIIFQLRDDVLGVFGSPKSTGKSVGGDIRERKLTWLYYQTVKNVGSADSKKLQKLYAGKKLLDKSEQAWVMKKMHEAKVEDKANSELLKYKKLTLGLIKNLPLPKKELHVLEQLIDYLVVRNK